MSSPAGALTRAVGPRRRRASASSARIPFGPPRARHQRHVRDVRPQRRGQQRRLAAPVRRHDDRRGVRRAARRRVVDQPHVVLQRRAHPHQRPGHRPVAEHDHEQPAGSTGSRKMSTVPPDRHGFSTTRRPPGGRPAPAARGDPQHPRLARCRAAATPPHAWSTRRTPRRRTPPSCRPAARAPGRRAGRCSAARPGPPSRARTASGVDRSCSARASTGVRHVTSSLRS